MTRRGGTRPVPAGRPVAVAVLAAAVALVVALVAGLVPGVAGPPPASAAPAAVGQVGGRLDVARQSGFVPSDGTFEAVLAWDGPLAGLDLEVRVYQLVGEEEHLDQRTRSGPLNQLGPIPLTSLPRDGDGNLVLRVPIRGEPVPDGDPSRVYLPDPGVYPLQLEIVDTGGKTVASLFTELVRLPVEVTAEPVPVTVALIVGDRAVGLDDAVALLERYPDVAVTVVLDPSTVASGEADPATLARLRSAIGDRPVVAVDPVPLDVSALAEVGRLDLYDTVRRSGTEQVAQAVGREVGPDLLPIEQLPTPEAAAHLAAGGAVLLAPTGADEGVLDTLLGPLPVLSPDEDLMDELAKGDGHRVLARLALRYRDGRTDPVVLSTEPGSGVSADDLAVVLEGLSRPGIVEAAPVADAASRVSEELEPGERPAQDLRPSADLLAATVEDLRDYTEFYVSGPLSPQYLQDQVVGALATDVSPSARVDRLAAVRRDIAASFDTISLPEGRTVNLAATTSPLPLTVSNQASGDRRIRITFASDKLTFPGEGGDSRLVQIPPGTSSFEFVVESRSLGVSPLDVIITTPDGDRVLTRTRITIRSTAVPGLGLLLSGAALLFLVVWWVLHFTRRRRAVPGVAPAEQVA